MTRVEYQTFRGWTLPLDDKDSEQGYLVEYFDGNKPNTTEYSGYVGWSAKDVFEGAYRPASGLTFGIAIEALKAGKRVKRTGWNGKDTWLVLRPGKESDEIPARIDFWAFNAQGERTMLPGWCANSTDMLAEDWIIID